MKTSLINTPLIALLVSFSMLASAQDKVSQVEFDGNKNDILTVTSTETGAKGTLTTGEEVGVECTQGACSIVIDYKGRSIKAPVGERITVAQVSEFDFGADEDLELVVVNDHKGTAVLYVFAYARGIIQKLYEREVFNNRTVIKSNYIELYTPGGLDTVWNYYQGMFWVMKAVEL